MLNVIIHYDFSLYVGYLPVIEAMFNIVDESRTRNQESITNV